MRIGKGMTFDPAREECCRAPGMASHHLSWPPWKPRTEDTPLPAASSERRTGRGEVSTLPQGRGAEAGQPPLLPGRRRWRCARGLPGHALS